MFSQQYPQLNWGYRLLSTTVLDLFVDARVGQGGHIYWEWENIWSTFFSIISNQDADRLACANKFTSHRKNKTGHEIIFTGGTKARKLEKVDERRVKSERKQHGMRHGGHKPELPAPQVGHSTNKVAIIDEWAYSSSSSLDHQSIKSNKHRLCWKTQNLMGLYRTVSWWTLFYPITNRHIHVQPPIDEFKHGVTSHITFIHQHPRATRKIDNGDSTGELFSIIPGYMGASRGQSSQPELFQRKCQMKHIFCEEVKCFASTINRTQMGWRCLHCFACDHDEIPSLHCVDEEFN